MSIDRRLRTASNALREVELAVPDRVPRGSAARTPTLALPVLMLVFGAALAMTGLDRTPGSEPIAESAIVVESSAMLDGDDVGGESGADPADIAAAASLGASYDIDGELRLIRELRRRAPSGPTGGSAIAPTAPDANAERALINAIVERPAPTSEIEAPASDADSGRPIVGLI